VKTTHRSFRYGSTEKKKRVRGFAGKRDAADADEDA
jgi:hypothetical protein